MVKSYLRIVSVILIACFLINCNMYLNVYANPAAITATVQAGGEVIQFSAEVLSLFAAQMHSSGIDIDLQDTADAIADYFYYSIKEYEPGEEGIYDWCTDHGYQYNPDTGIVTARDGSTYELMIGPLASNFPYTLYPVNDCQASFVDGEYTSRLKDYVTSNGTRVKTAVKTSYDTLSNVGAKFYDYFHNSDTVQFVLPMTGFIGSADEISADMISKLNACLGRDAYTSGHLSYVCGWELNGFKYADLYYVRSDWPVYDDRYYDYAVVILYNDKTSYHCALFDSYSPGGSSVSSFYHAGDFDTYDLALTSSNDFCTNYYHTNMIDLGMTQVCHYAISATGDVDYVDTPAVPTIKVGDNEYGIDNTRPNAWDNPDAITSTVAGVGAFDDSDETILALPGVTDNAWDWDEAVPDVLNPADTNVSTAVPESVAGSNNVIDWVKDFFENFFSRLALVLKVLLLGLFAIDENFLPSWYDKFQEVFASKGYKFDFSYLQKSNENPIPDIYITWKGIKILFMPSSYIYSCAQFVRPYIRAFIYFLVLMHDRKRLIYLIRGKLPPDSEFDTLPPKH